MPRGAAIKHVRKAGAFTNGQLFAGEWGLDVTNNDWYFSTDGATVQLFEAAGGGGATNLNDMTDVSLASLAEGNVLSYDDTIDQWVNRTPAQAGLLTTSQRGSADGVASLGSDGKIPTGQLPALAVTSVSIVASQAAQLALTAQAGDVAIRTDINETYIHNGGSAGTMADWTEIRATEAHVHSAADITSGDLAAARMQANIVAALNLVSSAVTINNPNITIDAGTL